MRNRANQFISGFIITAIFIGTLCGFMVVDMSTDRYMPGQVGPILAVTQIDNEGLRLSLMGQSFTLSAEPFQAIAELSGKYRGLLPLPVRIAAAAAEEIHEQADAN